MTLVRLKLVEKLLTNSHNAFVYIVRRESINNLGSGTSENEVQNVLVNADDV